MSLNPCSYKQAHLSRCHAVSVLAHDMQAVALVFLSRLLRASHSGPSCPPLSGRTARDRESAAAGARLHQKRWVSSGSPARNGSVLTDWSDLPTPWTEALPFFAPLLVLFPIPL